MNSHQARAPDHVATCLVFVLWAAFLINLCCSRRTAEPRTVSVLSPRGDLCEPPTKVRWIGIPEARRYRLRIETVAGEMILARTAAQPSLILTEHERALCGAAHGCIGRLIALTAENDPCVFSPPFRFSVRRQQTDGGKPHPAPRRQRSCHGTRIDSGKKARKKRARIQRVSRRVKRWGGGFRWSPGCHQQQRQT